MIVDDILIQLRSQLNKFDIGCGIRQGGEGGIFKILEKKSEEKPRRYDHGEGSNKKEGHNQQRDGFIRPIPQRRSSTSRYQTVFLRYNYSCPNYGHKAVHCKDYEGNIHGRNIKETYLAPRNVEFYNCHTYGHIARNCRSFITISTRQEHPKVRKRKY